MTNLDVTSGEKAAAVEHWYRHRTQVENLFRDTKHGAALRHLPSGHAEVNRAWMWGALLAASITGWLHQLTARTSPDGRLVGHGIRDGQAMMATLRHRLIHVPARPGSSVTPARSPCVCHPVTTCSKRSSLASGRCPHRPDHGQLGPNPPEPAHPRRHSGRRTAQHPESEPRKIIVPS